jgi:hypothetical protein
MQNDLMNERALSVQERNVPQLPGAYRSEEIRFFAPEGQLMSALLQSFLF